MRLSSNIARSLVLALAALSLVTVAVSETRLITGGFVDGAGTPGTQPSASNGGAEAPLPDLTQNGFTFYFLVPGTSPTATYTWPLANGDTGEATADFNVIGPTGVQVAQPASNSASIGPSLSGVAIMEYNGIEFSASYTSGSGTFQWVQFITGDEIELMEPYNAAFGDPAGPRSCYAIPSNGDQNSPEPTPAAPYLDSVYPYIAGITAMDYPSLTIGANPSYGEASISVFNATMYLMWDPTIPPAGLGSCMAAYFDETNNIAYPSTCSSTPVPLGSISWSWKGCAVNTLANQANGTQWIFGCAPSGGPTSSFAPAGYPHWQYTRPSSGPSNSIINLACSRE